MTDINNDMDMVRKAVATYEGIEQMRRAFMGAHSETIEAYQQILEERNTAISEVKRLLKTVGSSLDQRRLDVPPFVLIKTQSHGYDAGKILRLCPAAFQIPGVVKSIDPKILESAVGEGRIDANVLMQTKSEGNHSMQVRGPMETSLKTE